MEKILNKRLKNIYKNEYLKEDKTFHLLYGKEIAKIVPDARNIIYQARDIYFASKSLSLLSKPILLFYCFEKLVELLFRITFREIDKYNGHGLAYPKKNSGLRTVQINKVGLFSKFHHSISIDNFYENAPHFRFEDIINCGPINLRKLESYHGLKYTYSIKNHNIKTNTSYNQIEITEIDREFIFVFVLSDFLSRYNIREWSDLLTGKKVQFSKNIKIINFMRRYVNAVETSFPNLILNEIYRKNISFFYPATMMANEINEYEDKEI